MATKLEKIKAFLGKLIKTDYLIFLVFFVVACLIFYLRFPNNFAQPNFYAEDGYAFAHSLIVQGVLKSLFQTFNGYLIWGIYLLEGFAFIVNKIFYHGYILYLPQSLALTSYLFLGLCVSLPVLLFRKWLGLWPVLLMAVLGAFVPMVSSDYAIIGTIGNLKFLFLYLAFQLVIYRNLVVKDRKKVFIIDFFLLLCAFTNINVYLVLPFGIYPYLKDLKWESIKKSFKDPTFYSYGVLGLLCFGQLILIKIYGLPKLPGYLDSPLNHARLIETLIYRPLAYVFTFPFLRHMEHLGNLKTISLTLIFFALVIGFGDKKKYIYYLMGFAGIFIPGIIFALNRTGITNEYFGYLASGPDQFYYAQNLIAIFVAVMLLGDLLNRFERNKFIRMALGAIILLVLPLYILKSGSFGKNNFMEKDVGTIYNNALNQCATSNAGMIELSSYPALVVQKFKTERGSICNKELEKYQKDTEDLGLKPVDNDYVIINRPGLFTQSFISNQSNLDGLSIYTSTFMSQEIDRYQLFVYGADCKTIIRKAQITRGVIDNSYKKIYFEQIRESAGRQYCFTISPDLKNGETLARPVAIQLSAPDLYKGETFISGVESRRDIVFKLLYNRKK